MIVFPAIDLKNNQCVRLLRGDMNSATVYNTDPAAQARAFAAAGADHLHVVDLDGALAGQRVNTQAVKDIRRASTAFLQLGGGIRSLDDAAYWFDTGIDRVVLGTAALHNPDLVSQIAEKFPQRVAVGADVRNGLVAVAGWTQTSTVTAIEFAQDMEKRGAAAIIYTNIERDGALNGVDVTATTDLARTLTMPVIASGGVATLDDITALRDTNIIAGVVCGRALYDGKITLSQVLKTAGHQNDTAQNTR